MSTADDVYERLKLELSEIGVEFEFETLLGIPVPTRIDRRPFDDATNRKLRAILTKFKPQFAVVRTSGGASHRTDADQTQANNSILTPAVIKRKRDAQ